MGKNKRDIGIVLGGKLDYGRRHWSLYGRGELQAVGQLFDKHINSSDSLQGLQELAATSFYEIFIPELWALKKVPQHKQASKDAFHHSLNVCFQVKPNHLLKWAALLHDIGKAQYSTRTDGSLDFRNHEFMGAKLAKGILKRMKIRSSGDIYKLVQYHSHPLDYQRQPNWKMSTVKKFIGKYGHLACPLIDLAIADKFASSHNSAYLDDLYKLKQMVEEIEYNAEG